MAEKNEVAVEKKKEVVEQIKNVYLMEYKELAKCMNKLGL